MGERMRRLLALTLVLPLVGTSCYKNTYSTGKPAAGEYHKEKVGFFIYGLIGEADVDLAQICPSGVAWFQNRMDIPDSLVSCLTCNIYTPMTVEVKCASGSAFLAVPDPEYHVTWVYDMPADTTAGGAL
jgi:hypothetical protein